MAYVRFYIRCYYRFEVPFNFLIALFMPWLITTEINALHPSAPPIPSSIGNKIINNRLKQSDELKSIP